MKIIISGASGLVGSALVPDLTTNGHDVVRLVRPPHPPSRGEAIWDPANGKIDPQVLDGADVVEKQMQYLYNDGTHWYFMDQENFEQIGADGHALGDAAQWLKEQDLCLVTLFDGNPIVVVPPNFVELEIVETDPGVRGDTSSGGTKPATLETGAVVRVPLFVQQGERIKVDTRTGAYVSRA